MRESENFKKWYACDDKMIQMLLWVALRFNLKKCSMVAIPSRH